MSLDMQAQSLAVYGDHMDRVLHDIVDEGMKQEYFLNELDSLLRTSDFGVIMRASSRSRPGENHKLEDAGRRPLAPGVAKDGATQTDDANLVQVRNAIFDADLAVRNSQGYHMPLDLRPHMTSFPQSMRIPSQRMTTNTILRIYLAKLKNDRSHDEANIRRLTACQFLPVYYRSLYGQADIIDTQVGRGTWIKSGRPIICPKCLRPLFRSIAFFAHNTDHPAGPWITVPPLS